MAGNKHADSNRDVELSIIIPAHNSSGVIEETAGRIAAASAGRAIEIIVVENGSTDDTFDVCTRLEQEWSARGSEATLTVLQSEKGLGNALRVGSRSSVGHYVLLTADDLPFGFDDLAGAQKLADANGQQFPTAVVGSKAHPDSTVERGALRGVLTWGFATMRRLVLGMRTADPQGTVFVDGELLRGLAPDIVEPGFLFTTELIYVLERLGVCPVEVPVTLSEDHSSHGTRISKADVVSMGLGLFRLRKRHHEGKQH